MKTSKLLASVLMMLCMAFAFTSCSTRQSIEAAFAKNGYTIQALTPPQQAQVAPILQFFPTLNLEALGFLELDNSITFVYSADELTWEYYGDALVNSGFKDAGIGYVKSNYNTGMTYNVSGKVTELYGQPVLLITYTCGYF